MIVRIVLYVVAALVLAAHFYRAGELVFVALCVATPFLFLHRRRYTLLVLQALAYAGALVWIHAAVDLVYVRTQLGRPWTAAVVILGSVALVTALAGVLLNGRAMRERFPK
ncbi:MAG: hypothetical protein U1F10_11495 [Burkholderiales bacterium]